MSKKEIDDELRKSDPDFLKRQCIDLDAVKFVVGYRWNKGGKDDESRECFKLFDKRDRNYIGAHELKQTLGSFLDFPVNDTDV